MGQDQGGQSKVSVRSEEDQVAPETPDPRNARYSMTCVHYDEAHDQLRVHRLAVELYDAIVERRGIHDEQAELALRLVESTRPDRGAPEVYLRFTPGLKVSA